LNTTVQSGYFTISNFKIRLFTQFESSLHTDSADLDSFIKSLNLLFRAVLEIFLTEYVLRLLFFQNNKL